MTVVESLSPGWATAEVSFLHTNGKISSRYEIIDLKTGDRYRHEPMRLIALKCFELFLGLPLYFGIYTLFHLVRMPIATFVNRSPTVFFKQIWAIVRIPFYWIALECAALRGIVQPLQGRVCFGRVESALHDGKGLHNAVQYHDQLPISNELVWEALSGKESPHAFFFAVCMQPIGTTSDPHIVRVEVQTPPTA